MAEKKQVLLEDALDAAETPADIQRILREYEEQKAAEAARKEEERINTPNMFDKFLDGIEALKKRIHKKRKNTRVQDTQKTR